MSQVGKCKRLAAQGVSIREISTTLAISRNTVRRYLRGAIPGVYKKRVDQCRPAQLLVSVEVKKLLTTEIQKNTPKKQRLTASRIHRILEDQGFEVSLRTVSTVVKQLRQTLRDPLEHAYLPLEYDPAQDAQVDFYEAQVDDEYGGRRKIFVLIVRACYSKKVFRYAAPNQTREALLEGLIQAFEFFGGVFHNVWFDNLTPAVKKVLKGRDRHLQDEFESFANYYGFQAQFCSPGKGNEKGGVEKDVQYSRIECFSPIPVAPTRSDVQLLLDKLADKEKTRIPARHKRQIQDMWGDETPHLIEVPKLPFTVGRIRNAKVSNRSWIQSGTNFYSVPVEYVSYDVQIRLDAEEVVVFHSAKEIARHQRQYGREAMALKLNHYLPLLERKHRGLDRAVPVRSWLKTVSKQWETFLRELRSDHGEVNGSRQFVEALNLTRHYSIADLESALDKSLKTNRASIASLRYYLGEINKPTEVSYSYAGPKVQPGSVAEYGEVFSA